MWRLMLSSWRRTASSQSQSQSQSPSAAATTGPSIQRSSGNRALSSSSTAGDYSGEVDEINTKFAEAREEIELASESKETVYFNEEAQTARDAVNLVLDKYQALLAKLPDPDRGAMQRSMGLKMEQLKAELQQLDS